MDIILTHFNIRNLKKSFHTNILLIDDEQIFKKIGVEQIVSYRNNLYHTCTSRYIQYWTRIYPYSHIRTYVCTCVGIKLNQSFVAGADRECRPLIIFDVSCSTMLFLSKKIESGIRPDKSTYVWRYVIISKVICARRLCLKKKKKMVNFKKVHYYRLLYHMYLYITIYFSSGTSQKIFTFRTNKNKILK